MNILIHFLGGLKEMKDENLVTYCGLYCGDCFNYTGSIADMARDLRKELRKINLQK